MATVLEEARVGVRKIDARRGGNSSIVQSQWMSRPDDERFLSLEDLAAHVRGRRQRSSDYIQDMARLTFGHDEREITVDLGQGPMLMTNWSFGQVARSVNFAANELRKLPPYLGTAVLQTMAVRYGRALVDVDDEDRDDDSRGVMAYREAPAEEGGLSTLRALTSARYGRIFDADVVGHVEKIARAGSWKVPGMINWADGTYDPDYPVSLDTTTLFASDRDIFCFLVDDHHPIEIGRLGNGDPDLVFRGFIVSNSEVGRRKFSLAMCYLRGVCCNRMLWGVEGFRQLTIRHSSKAPERFTDEAMISLDGFAAADPKKLMAGVVAAKELIVARDSEDQVDFLVKLGFGPSTAKAIVGTGEAQEGQPPRSVWDFAQAITAHAQASQFQDARFELEQVAGKLLDRVKV